MPHIPFRQRPRPASKLPEPTRAAPMASQPLARVPEVPELDMPLVPVDHHKPPVQRHNPPEEQKLQRAPGVGKISMRTYTIPADEIAKRFGLD